MEIVQLDSVGSTSSWLASMGDEAPHGLAVMAREQTAGRGQRGNSWEAEPGMNITLSLMLRPQGLHPGRQFVISQAVSLAIVDLLDTLVPGRKVSIKWPNDIYIDDRKVCGILIENSITGLSITRCIVGIGLNVNQLRFLSDAPNPVSVAQLTGETYDVGALAERMVSGILDRVADALASEENAGELAHEYFGRLWRNEGWWPYHDNNRDVAIEGRIDSIAPTGHITITDRADGNPYVYAFKEITAII